jgi:hypothetical protein
VRQEDAVLSDFKSHRVPGSSLTVGQDPIDQVALEQAKDLLLPFPALILLTDPLSLERTIGQQPQGSGREQNEYPEESDPPWTSVNNPPKETHGTTLSKGLDWIVSRR